MLRDLKSIYIQHKDGFTITLSQLRVLLSNTISTKKKIHLALISNERHEKGLTWKNIQSGRRSFQTKSPLLKNSE